jgi:ATP-dependent DNA helicase RecG
MVENQGNRATCTIAGLVLFGRGQRHYLRHAGARWMSFTGKTKDYQAEDDTVLDGPLVALRASSGRNIVEDGLIERLMNRMRPFISEEGATLVDGLRRERTYRYVPEVVREALLNAFIHRDWTRAMEVEVVNYTDRLEIISPGTLQNAMTIDKMLAGQRSPRNSIIVDVMRDYGYIDARGMGVYRKIVPLTREYTGEDPIFDLTDDYLRVVIPARRSSQ